MLATTSRLRSRVSCLSKQLGPSCRWSSSTSEAPPPLLTKIRNDLKNAMRAKDTARLNVLRSIITETSNAAKGPSPVTNDMQILAMLRKRKAASNSAAEEAVKANRQDLAQKQEAEIAVLDHYASEVKVLPEEAIRQAVEIAVKQIKDGGEKPSQSSIMKVLFGPGGPLVDKAVDKGQVAAVSKESLG